MGAFIYDSKPAIVPPVWDEGGAVHQYIGQYNRQYGRRMRSVMVAASPLPVKNPPQSKP